jgi:hypothetical protein
MEYATKKEAQTALSKARDKAGKAFNAWREASQGPTEWEGDAARKYYNRCTDELEEAMHEYAKWDSEDTNA